MREEFLADVPKLILANIQFASQMLDAICRVNNGAHKIKGVVNTGSYQQYFNQAKGVLNLYGATKGAFEQLAAYYNDRFGLAFTTLALFDIYGPRDWRIKLLPAIRDAQSSGAVLDLPKNDLVMNFVHSDDAVVCFLCAAKELIANPQDVNMKNYAVRAVADIRISEIVQLFEKIGERPLQTNWGKWAAPDREIEIPWQGPPFPGWQPKISLENGIWQLIESKLNEG